MVKWNWWKSRIIFPRENEHLVFYFLFFGLHLISVFRLSAETFIFFGFIQFRRRNYVIFTKFQSRLQKRPPMQNFTI